MEIKEKIWKEWVNNFAETPDAAEIKRYKKLYLEDYKAWLSREVATKLRYYDKLATWAKNDIDFISEKFKINFKDMSLLEVGMGYGSQFAYLYGGLGADYVGFENGYSCEENFDYPKLKGRTFFEDVRELPLLCPNKKFKTAIQLRYCVNHEDSPSVMQAIANQLTDDGQYIFHFIDECFFEENSIERQTLHRLYDHVEYPHKNVLTRLNVLGRAYGVKKNVAVEDLVELAELKNRSATIPTYGNDL